MNKKFYKAIVNLFSIVFVAAAATSAAPGSLDTTFGTGGIVTTPVVGFTNFVRGIAIQPDGKVIVVGEGGSMPVLRYNVNGTLDTSFNGTGIAEATPGSAAAVAIQPDGKIIVVGDNSNPGNLDFKVVRYNANGTLDTSFDSDGIVVTPIGDSVDVAYSVAIQADGKIVVSGRSDSNPVFVTTFAMVRYNTNGSLDNTFDNDGIVIMPGAGNAITDSLALQPDGKIVVAHNIFFSASFSYGLAVLRYNTNGSLDTSFNNTGSLSTAVGTNVEFAALALQPDGKIVVACSSYTSNAAGYDFWVVRYNSGGSIDQSFGTDGMVVTPIGAGAAFDVPKSVAIQANGKILVGGTSPTASNKDFATVRYNKNGSLDQKWGTGGIVKTDVGGNADAINAIAVQRNGRVIVAGESDVASAGTRKFALARYMGDAAESFDYDRDGSADISLYRPSTGEWYLLGSSSGSVTGIRWGISTDELASADYDGDLKVDIAVWRSGSMARLYILNSSDNTANIVQFGQTGDDPSIIGDYDGDGKADPAVYRPGASAGQQSVFYYRGSSNNPGSIITFVPWGSNGDLAARGDYNGDGRLDPTVFRPANGFWYSLNLTNNTSTATNWGLATDKLVPADYTGDGKTDYAVFRNGVWYILQSNTGLTQYEAWGLSTDTLVPADYDGDGLADVAVFRDGVWYIRQSSDGDRFIPFGLATDIPTPSSYLP
jgi:uncharacterized delta-60 repeat protein